MDRVARVARLARHGPPAAVLAASLIITAIFPALTAGQNSNKPAPPDCLPPTAADIARAATQQLARGAKRPTTEATMSDSGKYVGQQLTVESRLRGPVTLALPAESFVAPIAGSLVLYTAHTSAGSEVHAINADNGCDMLLIRPPDIVRSGLIDPSGIAVYVHSVSAGDRDDLGVTRYQLGSAEASRVVPPLKPDGSFGPTFATQLRWSEEGDSLAIQSCGFALCRTRVLALADGHVATYAGDGHGPLIGLTPQTIYVLDDSHVLPAALLAIDRANGAVSVVRDEIYGAALDNDAGRPRLTIETAAGYEEVVP